MSTLASLEDQQLPIEQVCFADHALVTLWRDLLTVDLNGPGLDCLSSLGCKGSEEGQLDRAA